MLISMVFKNFVHFKDNTIINLYASQKRQKENQSTNAHSGDILDCNALNIFVGAIKDPDTSKEYKVFIYNDGTEIILRSKIVNGRETNHFKIKNNRQKTQF